MGEKFFDKMNEILDISDGMIKEVKTQKPEVASEVVLTTGSNSSTISSGDDAQDDYEQARDNFKKLINKGNEAIEGILNLAKESESARSYEVAGQLIKAVSDVTGELLKLQKGMKELEQMSENESSPKNVTNALFVGSTTELQKLLKDMKKSND
jgi:hypothetical protein